MFCKSLRKLIDRPSLFDMFDSQVDLLLSFCSEMGFSSVVLVGHDDGGLLALKAAERIQANTSKCNVRISSFRSL